MTPPSWSPRWALVALGLSVPGAAAALLGGCNGLLGNDAWTLAPDGAAPEATPNDDAQSAPDSGAPPMPDSGMPIDSSTAAPPVDSGSPPDTATPPPAEAGPEAGSGLVAGLVLPPSSGAACEVSEGDTQCAGETCRISSPTAGTCDTFTSGHEGGFPCTFDSDCDDTLQCYNNECKVLCPLGNNCAGGCECLYVGNDTTGICCPGS